MLHLALSQAMVRLSARGSLLFWQFSGVCGLVPSGCCRAPSFILPQAASLPVCCSPSMCRAYLLFSYQSVCHVSGYVSVGVWTCGRVYEGMGVGQSWALVGHRRENRGKVFFFILDLPGGSRVRQHPGEPNSYETSQKKTWELILVTTASFSKRRPTISISTDHCC